MKLTQDFFRFALYKLPLLAPTPESWSSALKEKLAPVGCKSQYLASTQQPCRAFVALAFSQHFTQRWHLCTSVQNRDYTRKLTLLTNHPSMSAGSPNYYSKACSLFTDQCQKACAAFCRLRHKPGREDYVACCLKVPNLLQLSTDLLNLLGGLLLPCPLLLHLRCCQVPV
jgi:hypothetical protein